MKILLISSDCAPDDLTSKALAAAGYQVLLANSPKEAVKMLDAFKPIHLIVLDLQSVNGNGFEFLRFLKGLPRHGRLPVLMCSPLKDPDILLKIAKLGVHGFVTKPIDVKAFLEKVDEAIGSTNRAILIVDDEEFIRTLLQKIVEREGYESLVASNGEEALALLEKCSVKLIISDIMMPGISGLELLKTVKEKYASIPMILVSGNGAKATHDEAAKLADGFIAKPFRNVEISRKLQQFHIR